MTDEELNALAGEAATILTNAGATMVRVERVGEGWLVAAHGFGSGCASDNPDEWRPGAFSDPRELARHLVGVTVDRAPQQEETPPHGPDAELDTDHSENAGSAEASGRSGERDDGRNLHDHAGPSGDEEFSQDDVVEPLLVEDDAPLHEEPAAGAARVVGGATVSDPIDADFTDAPSEALVTDLSSTHGDGSFLIENHPDDVAVEEPEAAPPQDRFYGLDDLDRRRSLRIGDVVRIGASKYSLDEYATVQGIVVRETVDGVYGGPADVYERFVALSAVQSAQAAKVAFLLTATREEIEAFDPEAGWPE